MIIEDMVLEKLRHLPQSQKREVLHFVEYLESRFAQQPTEKDTANPLTLAAQALLGDYETDADLTA